MDNMSLKKQLIIHGSLGLELAQAEAAQEPEAEVVLVSVPEFEFVLGEPGTAQVAETVQLAPPLHHLDEHLPLTLEPATRVQVEGSQEACKRKQ